MCKIICTTLLLTLEYFIIWSYLCQCMWTMSMHIHNFTYSFTHILVPAVPLHLYMITAARLVVVTHRVNVLISLQTIREFTCLHLTKKKHLTSRPLKTFGSILALTSLGTWTLLFPADLNFALFSKWSQSHLPLPCKGSNGFQAWKCIWGI